MGGGKERVFTRIIGKKKIMKALRYIEHYYRETDAGISWV